MLENIKKSLFSQHWSRYTTVLNISHLLLEECTSLWTTERRVRYQHCYIKTIILPSYCVGDGSLIWLPSSLLLKGAQALNTSGLQWEIKARDTFQDQIQHLAMKIKRFQVCFLWQHLFRVGHPQKLLKEEHCCNKTKWNWGKTAKSKSLTAQI